MSWAVRVVNTLLSQRHCDIILWRSGGNTSQSAGDKEVFMLF